MRPRYMLRLHDAVFHHAQSHQPRKRTRCPKIAILVGRELHRSYPREPWIDQVPTGFIEPVDSFVACCPQIVVRIEGQIGESLVRVSDPGVLNQVRRKIVR